MLWKKSHIPTFLLCATGLTIAAFILLPVITRSRDIDRRNSCRGNLRHLGMAMLQYTQDYNEKFPLAATDGTAYGWADALQPYLKSEQPLHCPEAVNPEQRVTKVSAHGWGASTSNGYTDFPFNKRMEGKKLADISSPSSQIILLDGNYKKDVTDARYSFRQIPASWREDQNSPLYRHKSGANYLFADAHVKFLFPSEVQDANRPVF